MLCGAFSNKAHDVAEKSSGSRIGFGAAPKPVQPYARLLSEPDLIEFGVMPEFMGRIQRIVNLASMTGDDYYQMTARLGPVLGMSGSSTGYTSGSPRRSAGNWLKWPIGPDWASGAWRTKSGSS